MGLFVFFNTQFLLNLRVQVTLDVELTLDSLIVLSPGWEDLFFVLLRRDN